MAIADLQHQVRAIRVRLDGMEASPPSSTSSWLKRLKELHETVQPILESRYFQAAVSIAMPILIALAKYLWRLISPDS